MFLFAYAAKTLKINDYDSSEIELANAYLIKSVLKYKKCLCNSETQLERQ